MFSTLRFALLAGMALAGLLCETASLAAEPTRFTATVRGKGADVVLIPGLASPTSIWDATAKQLSGTHRVHIIQIAGFAGAPSAGNSKGPVIAPLIAELASYLTDARLDHPTLIGHSLGGFAALALAARHPDRVGRLLVVDASPFFPLIMDPGATPETARAAAVAVRDQLGKLSPVAFAAVQAMTLQRMIKDETTRATIGQAVAASDASVVSRAMFDLLTTDLRPELSAIRAPLTVLYAFDASLGLPLATVDGIARTGFASAPHARLVRIDDSFHFIMLDQPARFAAAVGEFLK